jgi:Pyruvate/2-oxoacid:ferredoxin oxidoreductase delta subunit
MSTNLSVSASLVDPLGHGSSSAMLKITDGLLWLSLLPFIAALVSQPLATGWAGFTLVYGPFTLLAVLRLWVTHVGTQPGIKNNGVFFSHGQSRGWGGWLLGVVLTTFYSVLYWWGHLLEPAAQTLEPLSQLLRGGPANRWFLYGFFYTLGVLLMGARMILRYRHNRYQIFRTLSVMFFQLGFAFLLPALLMAMQQPELYFTYFWPLDYDALFPGTITGLMAKPGGLGTFMVFWGVAASFIITPVLTWRFGKRWYCSWVCGCGGLAETAGDPFRQLSDKSNRAWRFERWSIHLVLVFIVAVTVIVALNSLLGGALLGSISGAVSKTYGFVVGAALSGVVGVGFYPLLGSRVWCRFFCPQAAILGLLQRFFSRFRITTNGGQCISCGNCSTYCEMGIDVRSYAMRGENIVRASCVGCGVCAAVCPRGVLKLENGATHADRFNGADNPLADLLRSLKSR